MKKKNPQQKDEKGYETLLRPIQDCIAKDWKYRLCAYLEHYCQYIANPGNVDFTEAAVIIRNSACYYSKRVDIFFEWIFNFAEALTRPGDAKKPKESNKRKKEPSKPSVDTMTVEVMERCRPAPLNSVCLPLEAFKFPPIQLVKLNNNDRVPLKQGLKMTLKDFDDEDMGTRDQYGVNGIISDTGKLFDDLDVFRNRHILGSPSSEEDGSNLRSDSLRGSLSFADNPFMDADDNDMDVDDRDDIPEMPLNEIPIIDQSQPPEVQVSHQSVDIVDNAQSIAPEGEEPSMNVDNVQSEAPEGQEPMMDVENVESQPPEVQEPTKDVDDNIQIKTLNGRRKSKGINEDDVNISDLYPKATASVCSGEHRAYKPRKTCKYPPGMQKNKRKEDVTSFQGDGRTTFHDIPLYFCLSDLFCERQDLIKLNVLVKRGERIKRIKKIFKIFDKSRNKAAYEDVIEDDDPYDEDERLHDLEESVDKPTESEGIELREGQDIEPSDCNGIAPGEVEGMELGEVPGVELDEGPANEPDDMHRAGPSAEEAFRQSMNALANRNPQTSVNSQIALKVAAWHDSMRDVLASAQKNSEFDIHEYGTKIIDGFSGVGATRDFSEIVEGVPRREICRYLLSSLMMANTYNVELSKTDPAELSKDCLQLKLLSTVRHHEEMDANFGMASSSGHKCEDAKKPKENTKRKKEPSKPNVDTMKVEDMERCRPDSP